MAHICLLILVSIVSAVGLTGCEYCGPSAEPSLVVSLQQSAPAKIDTLYALDTKNPLPRQPYSTTFISQSYQLEFPLNLNADSSRYVLQLNGHRDTLTVFYKRTYAYRDRKCGFVLDLYPPAGTQARTTKGPISTVAYLQNRDAVFPGGSQATGIQLTVKL